MHHSHCISVKKSWWEVHSVLSAMQNAEQMSFADKFGYWKKLSIAKKMKLHEKYQVCSIKLSMRRFSAAKADGILKKVYTHHLLRLTQAVPRRTALRNSKQRVHRLQLIAQWKQNKPLTIDRVLPGPTCRKMTAVARSLLGKEQKPQQPRKSFEEKAEEEREKAERMMEKAVLMMKKAEQLSEQALDKVKRAEEKAAERLQKDASRTAARQQRAAERATERRQKAADRFAERQQQAVERTAVKKLKKEVAVVVAEVPEVTSVSSSTASSSATPTFTRRARWAIGVLTEQPEATVLQQPFEELVQQPSKEEAAQQPCDEPQPCEEAPAQPHDSD